MLIHAPAFTTLRAANLARNQEWDTKGTLDLSFRGNESAGEIGEAVEAVLDVIGFTAGMAAAGTTHDWARNCASSETDIEIGGFETSGEKLVIAL